MTTAFQGDAFQPNAFQVEGGGVVVDPLIGRKYPVKRRRGIYHPRVRAVEVDKELLKIQQEKDETAELLATAQTDLQLTKLQAHNSVNRSKKLDALSGQIAALENDLFRLREEEEMMMLLSFVALEM
tara:strand:- start:187 stop:567 length:381 start_codon:yes stop_codon:yes gene_type:complete